MKKTFAVLSALLMTSSCATLSASADYVEQVVIAVGDENNASRWVTSRIWAHSPMFYYPENPRPIDRFFMHSKKIADLNPSQETFELGDIIRFENIDFASYADVFGTVTSDLYFLSPYDESQPYSISKVGSIFDDPETKLFTVTGTGGVVVYLQDEEKNHYEYTYDWNAWHLDCYQPDCVDLSTLHSGDIVSCITYNDVPMLVTEMSSAALPSGDADGNGELNILDVITTNRVVLGKSTLSNSDQFYHADLNQDGVIDATDSLMMLKRLVGLE